MEKKNADSYQSKTVQLYCNLCNEQLQSRAKTCTLQDRSVHARLDDSYPVRPTTKKITVSRLIAEPATVSSAEMDLRAIFFKPKIRVSRFLQQIETGLQWL